MAIGDAYATAQKYRALKQGLSAADDILLDLELKAVSRLIDRKTNNPFGYNKDATVTTRVYLKDEETAPIASTAGLIVKATTSALPITWADVTALTLDTDFELLPRNPISGWPYTALQIIGWASVPPSVWTPQTYNPDTYRVQVTAIHGWPAVPDEIMFATVELTALLRAESPYATDRIQELDQVVAASPQARSILKALYAQFNPRPIAIG